MPVKKTRTEVKRLLLYDYDIEKSSNALASVKDTAVIFIEWLDSLTKILVSIKHRYLFVILLCIVCRQITLTISDIIRSYLSFIYFKFNCCILICLRGEVQTPAKSGN